MSRDGSGDVEALMCNYYDVDGRVIWPMDDYRAVNNSQAIINRRSVARTSSLMDAGRFPHRAADARHDGIKISRLIASYAPPFWRNISSSSSNSNNMSVTSCDVYVSLLVLLL